MAAVSISAEVAKKLKEPESAKVQRAVKPGRLVYAYTMKIADEVVFDKLYEAAGREKELTFDDLIEGLPDSQPRYIVLSYHQVHEDGRASFPRQFIYYLPETSGSKNNMLYATTLEKLARETRLPQAVTATEDELNELVDKWSAEGSA
ncbi:hypothetical protein GGF46_001905 [Coemansia sp. RSA 552]|nr:hypothetical protein GGF46_001905 [Coemansia sp. RSA 552]